VASAFNYCKPLYTELRIFVIYIVFNPLKTTRKLLYLWPSSYRAVNTFHRGFKNQSVEVIYGKKIAVYSEINTKHINALCGQNVELLNAKPAGKSINQ
jgi:hypothetical protein